MTSNKTTLRDIADGTGFSINTVSRVLRGLYVAEGTRKRIVAAAEAMGYIGNSVASSMRSGSTRIVTIILGDIANPHYSRIIKAFVNILIERGYTATIYNTEDDLAYERNAILSSVRQGADGVLICPNEAGEKNVALLKSTKLPFVIFGRGDNDPSVTSVKLDDVKGGYIATKHLIESGCRNILFVNGPEGLVTSKERLEGHERALKSMGIPYRPDRVLFAPSVSVTKEQDKWAGLAAQISRMDFDGLLAFSDQVALKVMQGLRQDRGSPGVGRLPVVGFDNIMETFPLPFSLSSVGYAKEDMAALAPALLLEMLGSDDLKPRQVVLDVKLYENG